MKPDIDDVLAHTKDVGTTIRRVEVCWDLPQTNRAIRRRLTNVPVESVGGLYGTAEFHLTNKTVVTIDLRRGYGASDA